MHALPAQPPADAAPTVPSLDLAALTAPEAPAVPAPAPAWPWWQRIGFRYLLVFFALYAFPHPLTALLGTIAGALGNAAERLDQAWLTAGPFGWPGLCAAGLGEVDSGWRLLTTWLDHQGLAPYEVIHQRTGSGDTGHAIARLLVVTALSALATIIWSLWQRRAVGYPRLGRWLHLVVRFHLAFVMLSYGLSKFYGGQFGELSLTRLTQEIGDTWPMSMVGTFMQASKPYELFAGAGEVIGALLLFHRRTALLGACVTMGVMTNVCALNWLCGVPVKLSSAFLLACTVFLMAPYGNRLWTLFVSNRPSQPVDLTVPTSRWLRWPLLVVAYGWVIGTLFVSHVQRSAPRPWMQGQEKSALYGVWMVDKMLLDGQEVPVTDATRWRFFAIDRGTLAWVREAAGTHRYFDFAWDAATGTAQVKPRTGAADTVPVPWTCKQGSKIVPVDPPLLLRGEDRGKKIDGERRTLVLEGQWGGKQLELHTVEKVFRLQTGFRLRQELPDFW
ncbi:MAG TPA: hypothetical protein VFZ65_03650 [Planctomycetota bacterium]|nr:hypothetical protein [Planctomycetota bacterium]